MANTTGKKFGGRKKGSLNKRSAELMELAEQEGVNPFLFLAKVMKGDRRAFGHEDVVEVMRRNHERKRLQHEKANKGKKNVKPFPEFEEPGPEEVNELNLLPMDMRVDAAKDLMPYLHPKLKNVEHAGQLGLGGVLGEIIGEINGSERPESEE